MLRDLNAKDARNVPKDAPTGFVRRRWKPHVFKGEEIDRRFYELCVLSELRNALRSGDLWVVGSRQFRDFEEYLLSAEALTAMKPNGLPLAIDTNWRDYLNQRGTELHESLTAVNALAGRGELPDASLTDGVLKIAPLTNAVPPEARRGWRERRSPAMPASRVKITDLFGRSRRPGRRSPSISVSGSGKTSLATAAILLVWYSSAIQEPAHGASQRLRSRTHVATTSRAAGRQWPVHLCLLRT